MFLRPGTVTLRFAVCGLRLAAVRDRLAGKNLQGHYEISGACHISFSLSLCLCLSSTRTPNSSAHQIRLLLLD